MVKSDERAYPELEDSIRRYLKSDYLRHFPSENFRNLMIIPIAEVAQEFGATNLILRLPRDAINLVRDFVPQPEERLIDSLEHWYRITWALYESSPKNFDDLSYRPDAPYVLEKHSSRLLVLVSEGIHIPPGSLELVIKRHDEVSLANSMVIARLQLVRPTAEAINSVVKQYNSLPNKYS